MKYANEIKPITSPKFEVRQRRFLFFKLNYKQPIYVVEQAFDCYAMDGTIVHVEQGFESDGATIPWWLRWIYPQYREYFLACILHDKGYMAQLVNKEWCDLNFLYWMYQTGVDKKTRERFFWAVNKFGNKQWNKYKK
jgi:hypothetical protein